MEPLDDQEKIYFAAHSAAYDFGEACAKFRDQNTYLDIQPLENIITSLMTELWDRCFSQSEIRKAFETALQDMDRYAAGEERRP